jgi:hypothetical protein
MEKSPSKFHVGIVDSTSKTVDDMNKYKKRTGGYGGRPN